MLHNAAISALLTVLVLVAVVMMVASPAIYARTGRLLPERTRKQRADALLEALSTLPTRRRDGTVNATPLVDDCGATSRERYQVLRLLLDAGLVERRNFAGLTLMPSYVRLTDAGWGECAALRARHQEKPPTPITMTYLNTGTQGFGRPAEDVVVGPTDQHLHELYVALRADAREIYQQGLRADAHDCADEVERSLDARDRRAQWSAIDRAGHLVALAEEDFNLTQMVLKRLFGLGGAEHTTSSGQWNAGS